VVPRTRPTKPVFIGPLPPPVHGSSVMTEHLFDIVTRHGGCEIVDSSSSAEFADVGRLRSRNIVRSLRTIGTAARLLATRRPLVYLAPSQVGPALARDLILWVLAAASANRLLVHVHGCGFHRLGSDGLRLRRVLVRRLARRSHFILLSERYRSTFLSGIPRPLGLSYLPNAISAVTEHALTGPPIRPDGSAVARLLYVGAVTRPKLWDGLYAILRSEAIASELERLNVRLQVVIAGQFNGRQASEEFGRICAQATGPIEVRYLGGIFDLAAKGRLFASADCFILPTMHPTEGLPVTLIEALCAGLPIIAFDTGLCGEAVTGRNGWLVPHGDLTGLQTSVVDFLNLHARNKLWERRAASRSMFERRFSHEVFEKRLLDLVANS
jgi:glycosyltransferase involved in cell wall biosynthesis